MNSLEISKALALAIGWEEHHLFFPRDGMTIKHGKDDYAWPYRNFDYRDWNVIGPIAARYDAFPQRVRMGELSYWTAAAYGSKWADADTPQKAIALAVIEGAKK